MDHIIRSHPLPRRLLAVVATAAATLSLGSSSSATTLADTIDAAWELPTVSPGGSCDQGRCVTQYLDIEYPYHPVAVINTLVSTPDGGLSLSCTGVLLDSGRHVLTAAHCVTSDDPTRILRRVSVHVWGAMKPLVAQRVSVHARWLADDDTSSEFDVAILELDRPASWLEGLPLGNLYTHEGALEGWSAQSAGPDSSEPTIVRCGIATENVGRRKISLTAPCNFLPGGSGGPLLSVGPTDTRIVGVLRGHDGEGGNYWSVLEDADALYAQMVDIPLDPS
jgi:hypothetical protein